jgi:plastocyanin
MALSSVSVVTNSLRLRSVDVRPGHVKALRRGTLGLVRDGAYLAGVAALALAMAGTVYAVDRGIDAGAQRVEIVARDVRFEPSEIRITAGRWTVVELVNEDPVFHDWKVMGMENVDVTARANRTGSGRFVIDRPGTYRFVCTVHGHEEAGMWGTLIVEEE